MQSAEMIYAGCNSLDINVPQFYPHFFGLGFKHLDSYKHPKWGSVFQCFMSHILFWSLESWRLVPSLSNAELFCKQALQKPAPFLYQDLKLHIRCSVRRFWCEMHQTQHSSQKDRSIWLVYAGHDPERWLNLSPARYSKWLADMLYNFLI